MFRGKLTLLFLLPTFFIIYCNDNPKASKETSETVTDIDGNLYKTIKIGNQLWMAENLKVTRYRNGDNIPNVTDSSDWANLSTGAFCYYENNIVNSTTYGCLYNWYAVNNGRDIAPEGWHVPNDEDWKELEIYLGMDSIEVDLSGHRGKDIGGKLKEEGLSHWKAPNTGANNESGFTALPGGFRSRNGFYGMGEVGLWSLICDSNFVWTRGHENINSAVLRYHFWDNKHYGLSVRCIKD